MQLERPAIRVVVSQRLGSRVVSLLDRRTGREWLAPGAMPDAAGLALWASEEAVFGADQAFGWDECVPTVARTADPLNPRAPQLRDHGNFWGRASATWLDQGTLVTEWPADRWGLVLLRRLRLDSSAVIADYALHNPTNQQLPFLWAAHPLLQLEPGTRLHLPKVDRLTIQAFQGIGLGSRRASWPTATTVAGDQVNLDLVQAASARFSIKAFARGLDGRAGALAPDGSWLGVAWDPKFAPVLGLWLDYGAWPDSRPLHQVALEPATTAHDALGDAIADATVSLVAPGRTVRWWMRLEVGTHPVGLGAFLRG